MKTKDTLIRIAFLALFVFLTAQGKMVIWLLLFAMSLPVALLFGRLYCGYACPIHTVMRPVSTLARKLGWQTDDTPRAFSAGSIPWIALALSIAATVFARKTLQMNIPIMLLWIAAGALIALRYRPEVFHNGICPFGALQRTFGRFARRSKQVDPEACISCGLCEKACQADAIHLTGPDRTAVVNISLCHQCSSCSAACPKDAIAHKKRSVEK
jgi:NAD-dependent dihydropyrimidine dehydrogenase PreA subunit